MSTTPTETRTGQHSLFGWSLAALLREWSARVDAAADDVPQGTRGYQLLTAVVHGNLPSQAALASTLGIDRTVMTYLLDALDRTPAQVTDDLLTIVAQNRAAENLLSVWTGLPGYASNVTWRWFADPASRDSNDPAEHERIGRAYAADLRAGVAQRSKGDRFAQGLVADLLERSAEFRELWAQQQVVALTSAPKRIRHPLIGELDLQCDVVLSPATGHRLIIFRPRPGSDAGEQIAFLGVLGNQKFA